MSDLVHLWSSESGTQSGTEVGSVNPSGVILFNKLLLASHGT